MDTKSVADGIESNAHFTPLDGKGAKGKDWQTGKYAKPRHQIAGNAGMLLEHAGLTDIDLDSPEIAGVIGRFVPTNTLAIGRGGNPSHLLYVGGMPAHENMKDLDGNKMVEIRHKGKQVMWAGSVHPKTGEVIRVLRDVPPLPVPAEEDILKAYTAAVIAKYLPAGDRHNLALAYAGYLLRKGLEERDVYEILEAAWQQHHVPGEAFNDLSSIVADTARKLKAGNERVTGGNTLTEMIPGMTDALSKAWGWDRTLTPEEKEAEERQERISRAQEAWPVCESLATDENILPRMQGLLKDTGLVGEKTNAAILMLAAVSLLRGEPISAIVKGTSSVGKSEVIKRVVKALPKDMVVELQSVSDKALAYMGKDALKHKVLVIYELGGIGRPGSDALEMVKQGMSEGCIRRQIAESTNKGVRPKLVEVDGPMNVWTTTTRVKTDYELNNRVFELTPDDSREQTQQIIEGVFADDRPTVDFGPVQALFTWLAGQDNRVVLRFGPALGKLLPSSSVRMRREAPRVRNLICAHAALHQANRERDEQGRIVATLEDYEVVRALVEEFVGVSSERGVKPQVRTTVTKAAEFIEGSEHDSITVGELAEVLDVDNNAAWRRLRAAFPYIVEMDWKRERKKQYELGEDLPAESSVLPSKDRILQFCNHFSGEGSAENRGQITDDEDCKTRAKLAENSTDVRGVGEGKSLINGNYSAQQHADVYVPVPLAKSMQNCKTGTDGCPDPALCTQNCASFTDLLKDERAAFVARMIRSHAARCKILDWAVPSPDDSYGWMSELLPEHPSLYEYEVARGFEYVRAEKEEWEDYAEALSCFGYLEESANPVSAYKAIQEVREDWADYDLPTDAEWWVGNLEANDTPFTLEAVELALAS